MTFEQVEKDVKEIRKTYGDINVFVRETYYVCEFSNTMGRFTFLVGVGEPHQPYALTYDLGLDEFRYPKTEQTIKKLQEM